MSPPQAWLALGLTLVGFALPAMERLAESTPYKTELAIHNPYARAVRVQQVDSTCTCTRLVLGDTFLLPGGSLTLAAEVDNGNRSGPQRIGVSVYVTDPEYEPIEAELRWEVIPAVTVDGIAPGADPALRPTDPAWRDLYHFVAHERPDEGQRLRKRIRLESPAESAPATGLVIEGIDYSGSLWVFTRRPLAANQWLVEAAARDPDAVLPAGTTDETVVIRTNHPAKAKIPIRLTTVLDPKAGRRTFDGDALDQDGEPPAASRE